MTEQRLGDEGPLWMQLYNAHGSEELARWVAMEVGQAADVTRWWRERGLAWWTEIEPRWREYRRVVERWIGETMTEEDWRRLCRWLGPDLSTAFRRLVPARTAPQWTVAGWFVAEREADPVGLIREAYRQVSDWMYRERVGVVRHPRLCGGCGRAFVPDRASQAYCSARCRVRGFRARKAPVRQARRAGVKRNAGSGGRTR